MSKAWLNLPLTSLGVLVGGGTPPRDRPDYFKGDIPWLTGQRLQEDRVVILKSGSERISQRAVGDTATNLVPEGSVLVSTRVSIGKVAVAGVPLAFSQDVTALCFTDDLKPSIDSEYVAYAIATQRARLLQLNQGSTIVGITRESLGKLTIPLPPLSEQRRIVEILREAEVVRRHQTQAARTAAELIPSLFQQMFGDPISAPRNSTKVSVESFVAEFEGGKSLSDEGASDASPYRVLKISAVTSGTFQPGESKPAPADLEPESEHFVRKGDLLISRANTEALVGATALVQETHPGLLLPDKLWRFVFRDPARQEPDFVYHLFQNASVRRAISARASGTGGSMKNIGKGRLFAMQVALPPIKEQRRFLALVADAKHTQAPQSLTTELHTSLLARAFDGSLTARWREQNATLLATEAAARDAALAAKGIKPAAVGATARPNDEDQASIWATPTDGAWADLTQRQRALWPFIPPRSAFGVIDLLHTRAKEPLLESLSEDGFRRELEVFVARGALVHVSRPKMNVEDEREVFQHYYRKVPLPDGEPSWNAPAVKAIAEQLRARLTSS